MSSFVGFIEQLIGGLTLGGIYALIAVGFTMVYGIVRLWNFPHKDMLSWGAFMGIVAVGFGAPFFLVILFSMMVVAAIGVFFVDFIAYRPIRGGPRLSLLITAIGVSLVMSNMARVIWGGVVRPFPHHAIPEFTRVVLSTRPYITGMHLFIWGVSLFACVVLYLLVQYTMIGTCMRALAQDTVASRLMGIKVNRTISFTFAIGTAMGALGGLLMAMHYGAVHPLMGFFPGIKGFAASVLGGIGNIPGAMIAGLIIGVAESLGAGYLLAGYRDFIAYALMILVICLRPQGLFGTPAGIHTVEERWLGATAIAMGPIRQRISNLISPVVMAIFGFVQTKKSLFTLLFLGFVLGLPFMGIIGDYPLYVIVMVMLYMMLAMGLNIVPGFCGLLDLGYVGFYAIGAYTSALLTVNFGLSFWVIIPLAALNGAIWGILLGVPTLRLTGDYFAIVTFGFSEMVVLFITNEMWLTKGPRGIPGILPPTINFQFLRELNPYLLIGTALVFLLIIAYYAFQRRDRRYIPAFSFFGLACLILGIYAALPDTVGFINRIPPVYMFFTTRSFYYLILGLLVLTIFIISRLQDSRIGRAWIAIREDYVGAESCGINLVYYKVLAFAISASFGAVAGAFGARWYMFVSPVMFRFWESFFILCMVVLGGAGSIAGVLLGAAILASLGEWLRGILPMLGIPAEARYAVYGLIMILLIRFSPRGLIPAGFGRKKRPLVPEPSTDFDHTNPEGGA